MKKYLFFALFLFIISACQESVETQFTREGVSITSPKGWKITDQENIDDQGYYLTIEKDGLNSSGLFVLSWVNGPLDLHEWMKMNQDGLKDNIIFRNTNLKFGDLENDRFNNLNTISSKFTVSVLGLKHEGFIHVFYEKDKSFAVVRQEALEDKSDNKPGFEIIEQSFKVE